MNMQSMIIEYAVAIMGLLLTGITL